MGPLGLRWGLWAEGTLSRPPSWMQGLPILPRASDVGPAGLLCAPWALTSWGI